MGKKKLEDYKLIKTKAELDQEKEAQANQITSLNFGLQVFELESNNEIRLDEMNRIPNIQILIADCLNEMPKIKNNSSIEKIKTHIENYLNTLDNKSASDHTDILDPLKQLITTMLNDPDFLQYALKQDKHPFQNVIGNGKKSINRLSDKYQAINTNESEENDNIEYTTLDKENSSITIGKHREPLNKENTAPTTITSEKTESLKTVYHNSATTTETLKNTVQTQKTGQTEASQTTTEKTTIKVGALKGLFIGAAVGAVIGLTGLAAGPVGLLVSMPIGIAVGGAVGATVGAGLQWAKDNNRLSSLIKPFLGAAKELDAKASGTVKALASLFHSQKNQYQEIEMQTFKNHGSLSKPADSEQSNISNNSSQQKTTSEHDTTATDNADAAEVNKPSSMLNQASSKLPQPDETTHAAKSEAEHPVAPSP